MEYIYYALVAIVFVISFSNWRTGIFLCIALDALRDPVRKISEDQSILITVVGLLPWLAVFISVLHAQQLRPEIGIFRSYPNLRNAFSLFMAALIPAAVLSCILYAGGWKLAAIGTVSYVTPLFGIAVGFLFLDSEKRILQLLAVYVVVNSLMLVGTPLEYFDFDIPGLGGLNFEWIRYRQGYTVDLISGFYRSPDIMGLHAANTVMFAMILALRAKPDSRLGWIALIILAAACLLLCGRRKMIGIPIVFLVSTQLLSHFLGARRSSKRMLALGLIILVGFAGFSATTEEEFAVEYTTYASTMFTEGPERANTLIVGSTLDTVHQSGILGAGLGTGTQGSSYANVQRTYGSRGWQEDGVSRLVLEFGIPGAILLFFAGIAVLRTVIRSLRLIPPEHSLQLLQIGLLSVVLANAASFAISHQQFSGDPVSALLVLILLGVALGMPRLYWSQTYATTVT